MYHVPGMKEKTSIFLTSLNGYQDIEHVLTIMVAAVINNIFMEYQSWKSLEFHCIPCTYSLNIYTDN